MPSMADWSPACALANMSWCAAAATGGGWLVGSLGGRAAFVSQSTTHSTTRDRQAKQQSKEGRGGGGGPGLALKHAHRARHDRPTDRPQCQQAGTSAHTHAPTLMSSLASIIFMSVCVEILGSFIVSSALGMASRMDFIPWANPFCTCWSGGCGRDG